MSVEAVKALYKIEGVIDRAEYWCDEQLMPEGRVCMAALKDIRRIVREELNE